MATPMGQCPFGHGSATPAESNADPGRDGADAMAHVPQSNASSTSDTPRTSDTGGSFDRRSSHARDLHKTLDKLNMNKLPPTVVMRSEYKPPASIAWLVGTWKGKGEGTVIISWTSQS